MLVNTKDKCLSIYLQFTLGNSPHVCTSSVQALLCLFQLSCSAAGICLQPLTSTVTAVVRGSTIMLCCALFNYPALLLGFVFSP
jgi:hypothetical protein